MTPEDFGKRKRNLLFSDASNITYTYIPEHTANTGLIQRRILMAFHFGMWKE